MRRMSSDEVAGRRSVRKRSRQDLEEENEFAAAPHQNMGASSSSMDSEMIVFSDEESLTVHLSRASFKEKGKSSTAADVVVCASCKFDFPLKMTGFSKQPDWNWNCNNCEMQREQGRPIYS